MHVTLQMIDTLELTFHDRQTLFVLVFGVSSFNVHIREAMKVLVATRDEVGQELNLFTVKFICQPLTLQPIDLCMARYQHPSKLDLKPTLTEVNPN